MFLIIALAAATGFLTTFLLLHVGINQLWIRYACAVSLGYGAFLGLLWSWLHLRRDSSSDIPDFSGSSSSGESGSNYATEVGISPGGGNFGGGGASGSFDVDAPQITFASDASAFPSNTTSSITDVGIGDMGDLGDAGEALPFIAVIAAIVGFITLLGAILASAWVVWGAPTFLGEMVVDVALARGLYKHMTGSYERYWLNTALRHTFRSFLGLLVLLMIAGALMQAAAPNIVSLGQFIHYFSESRQIGG